MEVQVVELRGRAMTLMERLENEQSSLTIREREIARYLIENYPQAILQSASSIARATKISAATVVRFFAKLGYESFAEAQEEARREVAQKLSSPIDRMGVVDDQGNSTEGFLARHQAVEIENLKSSFAQIDTANFDAIVAAILNTQGRIYVLGEKNSFSTAYFIATHLNLCMDNVVMLETGQALIADRLLWANKNDLLICVSVRRYCPNGPLAAEHFRKLGAPVVVLTDTPLSPLTALASHRLIIQTVSLSVFDSFTATMSVAGALVGIVARMRRDTMYETLKRGQGLWDHFGTFTT